MHDDDDVMWLRWMSNIARLTVCVTGRTPLPYYSPADMHVYQTKRFLPET